MSLIIKNGTIVTATDIYKADIEIKDEKIVKIAKNIEPSSEDNTIDAKDKYIFPGIIDCHVHFELPMAGTISNDDFENGTKLAACGGVTTIIDYATQDKNGSLIDAILERKEIADKKVCIDYSLHGGITNWNIAKDELEKAFKLGITSFKMFMTYAKRGLMSSDDEIFMALEETKKRNGIICIHAESSPLVDLLVERYHKKIKEYGIYAHVLSRPDVVEITAIERALRLAELSKGNLYIVHITTGEGVNAIKKARERGVNAYAETCPQYLFLNDEVFKREDGYLYATCPQIKSKENQEKLWEFLINGNIHVIGTDHCTFTKKQKDLWNGDFTKVPYGLPGTETMLSLLYTYGVLNNKISLNRLIQLLSYNPAKIYGLYPKKGTIAIGSDGDITIFDPEKESIIDYKNLQTNCDWSPYQGMKIKGAPIYTISRGKIVVQDGKFIGKPGYGKFIPRNIHEKI